MSKQHYVMIESTDPTIMINGYDSWICPWADLNDFLTSPLEELANGQTWTVKLTIHELSDDEYAAFCAEHDIEEQDY